MSIRGFILCDSGAVTVDWVVVTAGLAGVGFAMAGLVAFGVEDLSADVKDQLSTETAIVTSFPEMPVFDPGASVGGLPGMEQLVFTYNSHSVPMLETFYANMWDKAQGEILDGSFASYDDDPATIESYADHLYAMEQALKAKGAAAPDGYPNFETAWEEMIAI